MVAVYFASSWIWVVASHPFRFPISIQVLHPLLVLPLEQCHLLSPDENVMTRKLMAIVTGWMGGEAEKTPPFWIFYFYLGGEGPVEGGRQAPPLLRCWWAGALARSGDLYP
jgi:hypothetical protein